MNRASVRILLLAAFASLFVTLWGCGSGYNSSKGGHISVQLTQAPPPFLMPGSTAGLVATVANDTDNKGVNWTCSVPGGGSCGSFSPSSTGYQIDTVYTAPTTGPAGAISIPVTVTATSVADSTQSANMTFNVYVATPALLTGQYAFVLEGYASFGMAGSVTLDGKGNITGGEGDASANSFYSTIPAITGNYAVDPTGHGSITFKLTNTSCCGTFTQTHA